MNISLFNNFGALNSRPVFAAVQQGLQKLGFQTSIHDMTADVAVIWSVVWAGRMKQNQAVWQAFRAAGKPVIVLEVGMLHRGHTWKVGLNGTGNQSFSKQNLDPTRPQQLNLSADAWRNTGDDIVIAVQRYDSEQWAGQPSTEEWLKQTVGTLRQHTDRSIVIRSHPRQEVVVLPGCTVNRPIHIDNTYDDYDFGKTLKNAWAVVNWNSGPGSQAIMSGVPAFVGPDSMAATVANSDLSQIENPNKPNRNQWLVEVSHSEWTIDEIASGYPLSRLINY
jgi:hypothetical protein